MQAAAGNELDVTLDDADGVVVVRVRGEVDAATAPTLRAALAEGQARRRRLADDIPLVVDLSGVTLMAASGLGVLVGARNRARALGSDLVLQDPSPRTLLVLDITRLLDVFAVEREADRRTALAVG
jgi:anti-sigma B factor antagonist